MTARSYFIHCQNCSTHGRRDDIAVQVDASGNILTITCEACEQQVVRLQLLRPLTNLRCAMCETGEPHEH
jgi:hypothetical protein